MTSPNTVRPDPVNACRSEWRGIFQGRSHHAGTARGIRVLLLAFCGLIATAGCGPGGLSKPTGEEYLGTWEGTIETSVGGEGPCHLSIARLNQSFVVKSERQTIGNCQVFEGIFTLTSEGNLKGGPMDGLLISHDKSSDKAVVSGAGKLKYLLRTEAVDRLKAEYKVTMSHMRTLAIAIENFAVKNTHYPVANSADEIWNMLKADYLPAGAPADANRDGWGSPLSIRTTSVDYQIVSAGSDRMFDESSWSREGRLTTSAEDIVYKNGRFMCIWEQAPR
jgi:hypothetical protein